MPDPNVPSLKASYIVALITTVVGLFATQGLIDNGTAKLVTGLAAALVPPALALGVAVYHANVHAAKVAVAPPVAPAPAVVKHPRKTA